MTTWTSCASAGRSFRFCGKPEASQNSRGRLSQTQHGGFLTIVSQNGDSDAPSEEGEFRPQDWLSASEAIRLVRNVVRCQTASITIATRAHAGLIRSRADLMIIDAESRADVDVPIKFWWADGHEALTQNWDTGDFETWSDRKHLRAFGVRFHRDDLERMVPAAFEAKLEPPPRDEARNAGGRRMSELWPDWVAELALQIHESGIPPGAGSQGADELIAMIAARLSERGLDAPARTTVQETVTAVLRRLRTA